MAENSICVCVNVYKHLKTSLFTFYVSRSPFCFQYIVDYQVLCASFCFVLACIIWIHKGMNVDCWQVSSEREREREREKKKLYKAKTRRKLNRHIVWNAIFKLVKQNSTPARLYRNFFPFCLIWFWLYIILLNFEIMGHIVIPRNVIARCSRSNLWVQLKKNPKYWVMVTASLIAAPSCAISTGIQKLYSYPFIFERDYQRLLKDDAKYEKYLGTW